jgi:hypothetical protein
MAENKKPVKVIKAGDMSPETKALPDEVVKPPKGIGSSEKDMDPLPVKKAEPKKKEDKVLPDQLMNNPVRFKKDSERTEEEKAMMSNYKKGGMVKSSASKRADGIAVKGKTRGKIC